MVYPAQLLSDMHNYFLCAIGCLCLLHTGLHAEECSQGVLAKRETFVAPVGGSLSLSCVVQHCGDTWTGHWLWRNSTDENVRAIDESARHHFTSVMLSANRTQEILNFLIVNQLDEGYYGYKVMWRGGDTDQGHLMLVNVTAAVASQRSVLHRVLICASACLCLPIILGLAYCLSSEVRPQPLPRTLPTYTAVYTRDQPRPSPQPPIYRPVPKKRSTASHKAPSNSQQSSSEVVYADISQVALKQQKATREPDQSTVYSAVRFS